MGGRSFINYYLVFEVVFCKSFGFDIRHLIKRDRGVNKAFKPDGSCS